MFIAPDAELDDGEFDVVTVGEVGKLRFLGNLPKVFKGTHVEEDEVRVFRARTLELSASRPFPVYADGEHLTDLPASLRVLPRALQRDRAAGPALERPPAGSGALFGAKRAAGAGDRRRQPGQRPRRRHDPARPGAAAARPRRDRPPRLRPRPRHDDRQRHQRQDDDGRDDRRDPRRRGPRPGPQPRRLEHDLGRGDGAARAARQRGALRGRRGLAAAGRRRSSTPR